MKKENKKAINTKGITLIALVITIVVLIILAVISMNAIFGENGIIDRVKDAASKDTEGRLEEEMKLKMLEDIIGRYTGDYKDPLESIGLKGMYRIETDYINEEIIKDKIDGIIEKEGKLYRCNVYITWNENNIDAQISDIVEVSEIEDKARALFLVIFGHDDPESEMIDFIDYNLIEYKSKLYQIINISISETKEEIYINDYEIVSTDDKIWKRAYAADRNAVAMDSENNIWIWTKRSSSSHEINKTAPFCISDFNQVEMVDVIMIGQEYNTDIVGLIGENKKIYLLNREEDRYTYDVICINDRFQSELGNILVKQAYISDSWNSETDEYYKEIHLVDQSNKIWIIGLDEGYNTLKYKLCLNDGVSTLSGVRVNFFRTSYYNDTIYIVDTNQKLWEIQNRAEGAIPTSSDIYAECLTDDNTSVIYGKRIKEMYIQEYGDFLLFDEEGIVYMYERYNRGIERWIDEEDVDDNIRVKKYIQNLSIRIGNEEKGWRTTFLDINGDLWSIWGEHINTNGVFNDKKIKDASSIIVIDEDNTVWCENTILERLQGKTVKQMSAKDVYMIIDSEGKLYKGGWFRSYAT